MNLTDFVNAILSSKMGGKATTYNLNTGELNIESGYLVSLKGHAKEMPLSSVASSVSEYIREFGFVLSEPDNYIAGYIATDHTLTLDVVKKTDTLCEARNLALTNRQKHLYDNSNQEIITMPNGDKNQEE